MPPNTSPEPLQFPAKSIGTLYTRDWNAQPFSTRLPNDKIMRVFQQRLASAQGVIDKPKGCDLALIMDTDDISLLTNLNPTDLKGLSTRGNHNGGSGVHISSHRPGIPCTGPKPAQHSRLCPPCRSSNSPAVDADLSRQ